MTPSLRRLMKEASELTTSPSPHFHAHPVSDSNLYDWHFTLTGPPCTPYAEGIYHGRIVLPTTYPLRPPSFRFLTPSGRFEVNREICLSISSHHEESWQPAWGIRTALLALRGLMAAEPMGQVGGMEAGEEVRREFAGRSRGWVCGVCGRSNERILRDWCEEVGLVGEEESATTSEDQAGLPPTISQSQTQTRSSAPSPSPESPNPVAVPSTQPAQPQPQPQAHPITAQSWLDRAILGVLIALALMILRRMTRIDEF